MKKAIFALLLVASQSEACNNQFQLRLNANPCPVQSQLLLQQQQLLLLQQQPLLIQQPPLIVNQGFRLRANVQGNLMLKVPLFPNLPRNR